MKKSTGRVNFFRSQLSRGFAPIKVRSQKIYSFGKSQTAKKPLTSFLSLLLLLFMLIVTSHFATQPKKKEAQAETLTKEVETFNIGAAPTLTLHAKVEKSGVVQIVAQSPGIVSKINVKEGQHVLRGTNLVSLASNYQGGSAASIQRQLAQAQYNNTKNTFDLQKDLIAKQRDLANKQDDSQDQLRDITAKSLDDTRNLISLNEGILSSVDANLKTLEDTNIGGANDAVILQTKQLKAQLLAGNNQAKSGLRTAEFQADSGKSPAAISDLSRDIAQKQLDLQEKTLQLGLDTAGLQLKLAQINESAMFPAAPFAGTVQRVHVKVGQTVAPGTTLVTIAGSTNSLTAVALVPRNIAVGITKLQSSFLILDGAKIEENPTYISSEATNGQLYSIIFTIPAEYNDKLTYLGSIDVEVPVGYNYTSASTPFIPLDSIHQTQDSATVFIKVGDTAEGKVVKLGEVQGSYVQITEGLTSNDIVILDRNVVAGDKISVKNPQ